MMIAIASNNDIMIFNDGISLKNIQVSIPNINVPMPNPNILIFHNFPKYSTENLVA